MSGYPITPNYGFPLSQVGVPETSGLWGETMNQALAQIADTLVDIKAKATTAGSTVDVLDSTVTDCEDILDQVTAEIATLLGDLSATEAKQPATTTQLSSLETWSNGFDEYMDIAADVIDYVKGERASFFTGSGAMAMANGSGYAMVATHGVINSIQPSYETPSSNYLTGIAVTYVQKDGSGTGGYYNAGTMRLGFENETDANGGTNLANIGPSGTVTNLSALNILWANRYNYRIGGANMYRITQIILYKGGVATETQTGTITSNIGSGIEGHFGVNINPANRNLTKTGTSAGVGYPKWIT